MTSNDIAVDDRIEAYVWRNIGKESAREMAKNLGVTPDQVLQVKRDMVDSIDEITIQVQKAKLLRSLQELADDAREKSKNVSDERNYSGMVNAAAGAIDKLLKELNRQSKDDQSKVDALSELRKREIVRLYTLTVDSGVRELSARFDLDETQIFDVFNKKLIESAESLDLS